MNEEEDDEDTPTAANSNMQQQQQQQPNKFRLNGSPAALCANPDRDLVALAGKDGDSLPSLPSLLPLTYGRLTAS